MKDWIPVIQELIWPIFIGVLLFWNRSWFKDILGTIKERVEEGSEFNLGPSGISVGQVPVLPDQVSEEDLIDDGYKPEKELEGIVQEENPKSIEDQISLSHYTSFWKMKNGRAYYRIFITTHADNINTRNKINRVVYHLHPTFKNPIRVVSTPENNYLLKTNGWGEFVTRADIYIKGSNTPIRLNRYIELKA